MKVIIIGNYLPDNQESMNRFAKMLYKGLLAKSVDVELLTPYVVLGRIFKPSFHGIGKLIGYIDKFIFFSIFLLFYRLYYSFRNDIQFHICDHSNSPYLFILPYKKTSITCHDVLAIQSALGYTNTHCKTSRFGILFQKIILLNLRNAYKLISVSNYTLRHLLNLLNEDAKPKWEVIHNSFNDVFESTKQITDELILSENGLDSKKPFLFHIGSSLPRKNRIFILKLLNQIIEKKDLVVCFAGQDLDSESKLYITENKLENYVIFISKPEHAVLQVLYRNCFAFIFPSLSEGFGWPLIEAQACGAPVIASDIEPFLEVSGDGAILNSLNDESLFINSIMELEDLSFRQNLLKKGFENVRRFETSVIINKYIDSFKS